MAYIGTVSSREGGVLLSPGFASVGRLLVGDGPCFGGDSRCLCETTSLYHSRVLSSRAWVRAYTPLS